MKTMERSTPELIWLKIKCEEILNNKNVKFKRCYYYSGPRVKKVKFYNISGDEKAIKKVMIYFWAIRDGIKNVIKKTTIKKNHYAINSATMSISIYI